MNLAARGFSLIELVVVMIVISVGFIGIARLFGDNMLALTVGEGVQRVAQYAQECAEVVIDNRRSKGFTSIDLPPGTSSLCSSTPTTGFSRSATVGNTYTGTSSGACNGNNPCPCPSGVTCKDVSISVTTSGLSASITLMLVNH